MNTSVVETFEAVLERQNQVVSQLQKILSNTKKKGEANYTVPFLEARIKLFEDTWIEIRQLNGALQAARKLDPTKESLPYFQSNTMDRMEDFYLDGWTMLKQAISRLTIVSSPIAASSPVSVSPAPVSSIQNIKLPRVEIPTFSGDCTKWKPYESRFRSSIILNPSLTDGVRLQYLLSSLSGDALAAVENLDVVDSNFKIAWERLKENFDNERLIVHALMRKLFSLESINMEQVESLRQFTVHFRNTLEALHKLGRTSQDDVLVYLVTSKFDKTTAREWRDFLGKTRTYPTFTQLEDFLFTKVAAVEEDTDSTSQSVAIAKRPVISRPTSTSHVVEETIRTRSPCSMCSDSHSVRDCKAFRKLSPFARFEVLKNERVCINCLSSDHTVSNCLSTHVCRECGGKHHTLLHRGTPKASKQNPGAPMYDSTTRPTVPPLPSTATSTNCEARPSTSNANYDHTTTHLAEAVPEEMKTVLLATALVKVYTPDGRTRLARALLDQGSQASFISNNLVQQLRLQKIRSPISVTGLGGEPASSIDYSAQISIGDAVSLQPVISTRAFIVKSITRYVPPPITVDDYKEFTTLALADPNPASDQRIEILLGAELYSQIIRPGVYGFRTSGPIAQNTVFGWILTGPIRATNGPHPTITANHGVTAASLEKALSRFWETEAVPESCSLTPQENQCEQHFVTTYSRDATGRFIVRLPFTKPIPDDFLGDSFRGAAASLKRLTNQLQNNDDVKSRYSEFIREYVKLGHMSPVSSIDRTRTFIPHRAVLREESLTTKLRVVFNASHKTSSGYSLNDLLHTGPKLQQDITRIILNWRLHEFVLVADIEKMFRQILVHSQDRKYQCILWENEKTHQLETYELNTVTYGTACAPYLSMRVLKEIGILEGHDLPLAAQILQNNIYVDDVFIGAPDKRLLEEIRVQVCQLVGRAGFHLRKWAGNDADALKNVPETEHSHAVDLRMFDESELKVLGIKWLPAHDAFHFDLQPRGTCAERLTKRELLSEIAKLFDPLGWLSPIIIRAKILMQIQWLEKIEWDDRVSDETLATWNAFCTDWGALKTLRVPRWVGYSPGSTEIQLHGFSDASRSAFSCAVYARVIPFDGMPRTMLLAAKSRVAPVKTLSIPILELNGAVMLTELIEHVTKSLSIPSCRIVCWTDSTIVLAWLRKHPAAWKTTVANRTSKIHTALPTANWKHVPTHSNPADLNSRGVSAEDLLSSNFWIEGPAWLRESEEHWPLQKTFDTDEEKSQPAVHVTTRSQQWDVFSRVSSWARLIRVFGYVRRYVNRTRRKQIASHLTLTIPELREAERAIISIVQASSFAPEIRALANTKPIDNRSIIQKLNPFLDQYNILRVGGRLRNSFLQWEQKHPVILPKHEVSDLLLRDAHLLTLHGGVQLTVYTTRRRYWIVGIRDSARRIIHRCVPCARWRAETATQIMQDLSTQRCRPSPPFTNIGLDYAGPFQVRESAGRGKRAYKNYVAVFVCYATRALHIELVTDLSTAAFLAALDRFTSRRGIPSTITSDNGTNFVGAASELAKDFAAVTNSAEVKDRCTDLRITWAFYPPGAPHHGGMQEAAVRSIKHHLRRIIGSYTPTVEEMCTLLCKIEATLNSRPITRVRDDPQCLEILCPGHFLTGGPLNTRPTPSVTEEPISHLTRWQTIQRFHELIWRTWSHEYLQELQSRYKWNTVKNQLQLGDVVLVQNPILPPNRWEMGLIVKTWPGNDGNIRVVDVKTATSVYRRPITRICKLPVA